jgi:hypothetical protein
MPTAARVGSRRIAVPIRTASASTIAGPGSRGSPAARATTTATSATTRHATAAATGCRRRSRARTPATVPATQSNTQYPPPQLSASAYAVTPSAATRATASAPSVATANQPADRR